MKLFQISKQIVLPELFQNLVHDIYMQLAEFLGIDKNVIKINNNKSVKFLGKDLIDIFLEASQIIEKTKKHDSIFKRALPNTEINFLFITLSNSHFLIGTSEVQWSKPLGVTQPVKKFTNQRQSITIFNSPVIETSIINA